MYVLMIQIVAVKSGLAIERILLNICSGACHINSSDFIYETACRKIYTYKVFCSWDTALLHTFLERFIPRPQCSEM